MMPKETFGSPHALRRAARIAEALVEPMTGPEVAVKMHLHEKSAARYLWHFARQPMPRLWHVYKWVENGKDGRKIPVFMAGNATNKRKPAPLTDAEKYKRLQQDKLKYAKRLEDARVYLAARRGRTVTRRVASPFAALGV